jgi:hypothetical protein
MTVVVGVPRTRLKECRPLEAHTWDSYNITSTAEKVSRPAWIQELEKEIPPFNESRYNYLWLSLHLAYQLEGNDL